MRRKQVKRFIRQAVNRFARIYGFRPAVLRYRAVQWGNRRGIHIEIYRIARCRGQIVFFHVPPLGANCFTSPTIDIMVSLIERRRWVASHEGVNYVLSDMPDCADRRLKLPYCGATRYPLDPQNKIEADYHTQMPLMSIKRPPRKNKLPFPEFTLLWAIKGNRIVDKANSGLTCH